MTEIKAKGIGTTVNIAGREFRVGARHAIPKVAAGTKPGALSLLGWSIDRKMLVVRTDAGSIRYLAPEVWAARAGEELAP
jgi:hypothetical protein